LRSNQCQADSKRIIEGEFLRRWGFCPDLGNPFEGYDLDKETRLEQVYVSAPYVNDILGGHRREIRGVKVIYAERGFGKSSLREIIRRQCARMQDDQGRKIYLPLVYGRDAQDSLACDSHSEMVIGHHLIAIVSLALEQLAPCYDRTTAKSLRDNPAFKTAIRVLDSVLYSANVSIRARAFIAESRPWYTRTAFTRSLLSVLRWFKDSASSFFSKSPVDTRPKAHTEMPSHNDIVHCLTAVAQLFQLLGFERCVVLVDEVDENRFVRELGPEAVSRFIKDLVTETFFRSPTSLFAVRFFLPETTRNLLMKKYHFREDRDIPITLKWQEKDIRTMLKRRLLAYSNNEVDSLNHLAEGFDIDSVLVRYSNLSPRRYAQLAHTVFRNHFERVNTYMRQHILTSDIDWEELFNRFKLIAQDTVQKSIDDLKR